jgi:hypothetical protein
MDFCLLFVSNQAPTTGTVIQIHTTALLVLKPCVLLATNTALERSDTNKLTHVAGIKILD